MSYVYYVDPGHGWLQVPTHKLIELGIVDKISLYSYFSVDGLYSYLEEDMDMSTFVDATGIHWDKFEYTIYHGTVRDNPPYDPQWIYDNEDLLLALSSVVFSP